MLRRHALMLPLAATLAACSRDPEIALPSTPIGFGHLLKLRLNVAEVVLAEGDPPLLPGDFGALMPVTPVEGVRQIGRDRFVAMGTAGQASFSVTQANLLRDNAGVLCILACRVDILAAEGGRVGYVDAAARANMTLSSGVSEATRRRAGEAMLRQALDKLNVELEFQVRRSLRDWLVQATPTGGVALPSTPAVQREELGKE